MQGLYNHASINLGAKYEKTRSLCSEALSEPKVQSVLESWDPLEIDLPNLVQDQEYHFDDQRFLAQCLRLHTQLPGNIDSVAFRHSVLLLGADKFVGRVQALPVEPSVKFLFYEGYRRITRAPDHWNLDHDARFLNLFKLVIHHRFPAWEFDWERSGVPLGWVLDAGLVEGGKAVAYIVARMGGRRPAFVPHIGLLRRSQDHLDERLYHRSLYRMASSMKLQPEIKGLVARSWLRSAETHRVSPHLSFLNEVVTDHGGIALNGGPADPESGVLTRSKKRRKLYEHGDFKPRLGLILWPREQMIHWADRNPIDVWNNMEPFI